MDENKSPFETGAGGSAPKHVQQFVEDAQGSQVDLRWDSLGEFLAIAVSLEDLANKTGNSNCCWSTGPGRCPQCRHRYTVFLDENKSPSRKGQLTSWTMVPRQPLLPRSVLGGIARAAQSADTDLQAEFSPIAQSLRENEEKIVIAN